MKNISAVILLLSCFSVSCEGNTDKAQLGEPKPDVAQIKNTAKKGGNNKLSIKNCEMAVNLLAQCGSNDLPCRDTDLTSMLPGAPRSTYVFLTKQPGFSKDNFIQLCQQMCQKPDSEIDIELVEANVCRN
jgi:hypothetical protein